MPHPVAALHPVAGLRHCAAHPAGAERGVCGRPDEKAQQRHSSPRWQRADMLLLKEKDSFASFSFLYFFMRYFMRFNASLTTCSTGMAAFSSSNALTTLAEGAGEKPSMVRAETASSMTSLLTATVLPPSPTVTS